MTEDRSLPLDALFGAVVATLLLVPFSALAGGTVAGYLHGRRGIAVGALSGVFAALPKSLLLFVAEVLFGVVDPQGGARLFGQFLLVFGVIAVYMGLQGALTGYLGVYLVRHRSAGI